MVVGDFKKQRDVVVIGAGPGGYVAAIRAAQLGKKVMIVEREYFGGICLNVGCIPSKALIHQADKYEAMKSAGEHGISAKDVKVDFKKVQKWKDEKVVNTLTSGIEALLRKNKVEIVKGEALFTNDDTIRVVSGDFDAQTYEFKHAIIATGSRPIELPTMKFNDRILDSTGALNLDEIPKSMVVIGAGYIGSELAGVYSKFGTKVTIIEGGDQILPGFDAELVAPVVENFKKNGTEIITGAMVKEAIKKDKGAKVTYELDGEEKTIEADYVLVTIGRKPNTDEIGLNYAGIKTDDRGLIIVDDVSRTNKPNIYAIGDVTAGPALAHKASYEGKVVASSIAGSKVGLDAIAIPAVCYTTPEIASTGFTLDEAKEQGYDAKATKFPYMANGRALSMEAGEGFLRLVSEKDSGVLLGAQVVGIQAGELIAELTMAIEAYLTVDDVADIVHAHPSLAEIIMDTAELAKGMPIHI